MKAYAYQEEGARFLKSKRHAMLLDEMGLGKTPQALIAASMVNARSIGVVCPAIARRNWEREFARWGNPSADFFVESFDRTLRPDVRAKLMGRDVLIIDEGHYLKNRMAKRTTSLYGRHACGDGIIKTCQRVWVLTGTPAPNDASELWTHFRALFGETMSYVDWVKRYCYTKDTPFGVKVMGNRKDTLPELREKLRAVSLRRRAADVLTELPPIVWQPLVVDAKKAGDARAALATEAESPEAAALRLLLGSLGPEGDEQAAEELARAAPHMAQIRRLTGLAKAPAVAEFVADELDAGGVRKVVIFAHHKDVIKELVNLLTDYNPVYIMGDTSDGARNANIDRFQTDDSCRVFVGQLTACATAVTLTAANQVVFAEASWTPADNVQAAKRAHRIGQTLPVMVKMVGLADSLDEAVMRVLSRKAEAISQILED